MRKTAKRFRMSLSSVYRRKRQYQETGKRQAKRLGGAAVDGEGLE